MVDKIQKSNFFPVVCPDCGGRGCPGCHELGLLYWYSDLDPDQPEQYILAWHKAIDWQHIAGRQIEFWFIKIVSFLLLVFGALGLIAGLWWLGEIIISPGLSLSDQLDFWGKREFGGDGRVEFFWLSILIDLYSYYRYARASRVRSQVIKKVWHEGAPAVEGAALAAPAWSTVVDSPAEKIDISLSYDPEALKAVEQAWRIAKNWHHAEVLPIHLLAGSFSSKKLGVIFGRLGADWEKLASGVKTTLSKIPRGAASPVLSLSFKKVLFAAYQEAYLGRQAKVTIAELLMAIDSEKSSAASLLYNLEIENDQIRNVVVWLQINDKLRRQWQKYHRLGHRRPRGEVNKSYTAVMTQYLDKFAVDLTRQAAYGLFPASIGQEEEIDEVFRVLQGSSESVILIGWAGVGKTTILEEIAQRMIADEVPKILQDKRLVSLSVPKLTAGATPAEANQRLLRIFDEIQRAGNVILVIEEVHDLVGISTGTEESLDLAEALINYLAKYRVSAITTTTPKDYSYLEAKTSLGNYLHKITVDEPQGNEAIQIVESRIGPIEYTNKVFFSYAAVAASVTLSTRYIHERYLPAKAIDLLKEAAVQTAGSRGRGATVMPEDVALVVSQKTKIPLTKIGAAESKKLVNLEAEIHERMVDQAESVKEVAAALRRARAGLRDQKRPIANFLFLGPTGVGKTELAKTIAEVYFGSETNMVRLDMSEYQTKESLYRLIGAPTGEQAGGYLTEAIRRQPFALVLFDEVEKAHPDILNLFLQVMDDGRLTDNAGRTVDFTNAIIIMTSNAGTKYIQEQVKAGVDMAAIRAEMINNRLGEFFRPEFLNRFDAINVFKPLTIAEVNQIASLMIKKAAKNLLQDGVELEVTPAAVAELAAAGFDPQFGARPLRRVIQERIDNTLANLKLENKFKRGDKVVFDVGGKVEVVGGN